MSLTFKTPSQVADEYLAHLKAIRPEVNTDQQDSDWWIRGQVVGGVGSGIYADQLLISNDAFPQSARHDALGNHLFTYFNGTFISSTPAHGTVACTGTGTITQGTQVIYDPNGNVYQATQTVVISATAGTFPVQSVGTGQTQNLLSGAPLRFSSPPAGFNANCSASGDFSDARDDESDPEASARILERIQNPISGGTETDYKQWAAAADPSVIAANVIRYYAGLGTVGVVVEAGTSNVDAAVDAGQPVIVIPTDVVINNVSGYIAARKPLTDCVTVLKPVPITQDVTVRVRFTTGNQNTILSGQTLTQGQLVIREVTRAIYKTPPGGKQFGGSGFIVASDIEETIDAALSNGDITGTLPILDDRDVVDLSASGPNRGMLPIEVATPGTITILENL